MEKVIGVIAGVETKKFFSATKRYFIKRICGKNLQFSVWNKYAYFMSVDGVVLMYFYCHNLKDGLYEFTDDKLKYLVGCPEKGKRHVNLDVLRQVKEKHDVDAICELNAKAFYFNDGPIINPFIMVKFAKSQNDSLKIFYKDNDYTRGVLVFNNTEKIYFLVMGMYAEASHGSHRKMDELDKSGNYFIMEE